MTTAIDLARLPAPLVIEEIDFETLYAQRKAGLLALYPEDKRAEVAATLELESEPLVALLQENTYREVLLRQRINDAARSLMLAYAKGSDLDHLAAGWNVARLVVVPANAATGAAAVMETDDDLRKRVQLAPESLSVAGTTEAYVFHALKADGRVLDVKVTGPAPAEVLVTILSREGNGTATQDVLGRVTAALMGDAVRPVTDALTVQSVAPVAYNIVATLYIGDGPDEAVIRAAAAAALDRLVASSKRIGQKMAKSAIYAALHQPGVISVELEQPAADIIVTASQAAWCSGYSLTVERAAP